MKTKTPMATTMTIPNRRTQSQEVPVSFRCGKDRLYGIVHHPGQASALGLLVVTGRPALRTGRHRLFVLLARTWAEAGIPVMRFDFRGTGDSEGEMGTLDDTSDDIASAVDAFMSNMPGLQGVVLWGLCGGAADSVLYAPKDPRVVGVAMVNPWSYDARVRELVKLHRLGSSFMDGIRRWARSAGIATRATNPAISVDTEERGDPDAADDPDFSVPHGNAAVDRAYASYRVANLSKRLADNLGQFKGNILLILSGKDTGSQAFKHIASISPQWRRLLSAPRVRSHELPESNHSLRRPEWRAQAAAWTMEWVRALGDGRD